MLKKWPPARFDAILRVFSLAVILLGAYLVVTWSCERLWLKRALTRGKALPVVKAGDLVINLRNQGDGIMGAEFNIEIMPFDEFVGGEYCKLFRGLRAPGSRLAMSFNPPCKRGYLVAHELKTKTVGVHLLELTPGVKRYVDVKFVHNSRGGGFTSLPYFVIEDQKDPFGYL